jgi:nucleoside 2-deoxyribosyltransferase
MAPRIYLAGPDVFLPDPFARAAAQKRICAGLGLVGVSPLDELEGEPAAWLDLPEAHRIARRNEAHIRSSHAILANITPFRGPSADSGTVYEIGFGRALGLPVFAYTATINDYATRIRHMPGSTALADADGLSIEDFDLADNLMIACAIEESGGSIIKFAGAPWTSVAAFERCASSAAAFLLAQAAERK